MNKTMIYVQYFGIIRLLLKKKEDSFQFEAKPDWEEFLSAVTANCSEDLARECRRQMFILYPPGSSIGGVMNCNDVLKNGSTIRIVSLVTGG